MNKGNEIIKKQTSDNQFELSSEEIKKDVYALVQTRNYLLNKTRSSELSPKFRTGNRYFLSAFNNFEDSIKQKLDEINSANLSMIIGDALGSACNDEINNLVNDPFMGKTELVFYIRIMTEEAIFVLGNFLVDTQVNKALFAFLRKFSNQGWMAYH